VNEGELTSIWIYLSAFPLLWLTVTLIAYNLAHRLYVYANHNPLLNPVATAITVLIGFLLLTDTSYRDYFEGAKFIHFLLGPATVALAIPLYSQLSKLKKIWLPLTVTLVSGVILGAMSSIFIAWILGGSLKTLLSLAPKSVTTPVAMGISETVGGIPSLTAVLVVATGILGAVVGTRFLDLIRIRDDSTKGVAMGIAAHGIGTARAFQISSEMGAFSGLAMALSALATALLLPWLLGLLGLIPS
jgi:predicted murein hydrolase (TIGR00659 family)